MSLLILTGVLLVALPQLASTASPAEQFLPTPIAPEPYPFSGRYPAVVYLDSQAESRNALPAEDRLRRAANRGWQANESR